MLANAPAATRALAAASSHLAARPTVAARILGRVGYAEGIDTQLRFVGDVLAGRNTVVLPPQPAAAPSSLGEPASSSKLANQNNTKLTSGAVTANGGDLLLLEHNPVYTLGRRMQHDADQAARLAALGAEYVYTSRGGQITFHGPGQLVGYPILNLAAFSHRVSVKDYVRRLEVVLMRTCADFGVKTELTADTGVWVGKNKIAALGIQLHERRVTSHGFALNCQTDLRWFSHIVPCGLVGKSVTSLSREVQREVSTEETLPILLKHFGDVFECDVQRVLGAY
ncbi:octanoyltransferase [Capsaspora owczarzaki ATCC 30864]|uniref:lipoyl(octanoyl) transferase n=1 Tax=Capsaspora owczarzaki (strain ATCC 30864) TaxID=595528 RepID=A0A0D2VH01_CAPO3|nr:octanoyltransferase [Capsaspora owczarzaki ATCC 30864]KJE89187.1 octanoyltransferase [Capsaspora owczarzaki ATCC 30864]|eukprot:XP_004365578.1 octanoyltransferase [Capsaspora owczarzaki ATCC 30864]